MRARLEEAALVNSVFINVHANIAAGACQLNKDIHVPFTN